MESRLGNLVIDAVFPRFCVRCRDEGAVLCDGCASAYRPRRPDAACPFCTAPGSDRACDACKAETYLDGVSAIGNYADPALREIVTLWKYHGDRQAESEAVRLVRKAALLLSGIDAEAITCVPLHVSRRRARGFDQAHAVAEAAAQTAGLPLAALLVRRRKGDPQAKVSHNRRLIGDLDGSFIATGPVPERVLLCDDVFTSGATMDAAAKALKEAGARYVWGFVLAKGRP